MPVLSAPICIHMAGSLYATGDEYGIGMRTMNVGNPGNLAILASDEKDALMAEMDAGDIGDIKDNAKKKTYYIGEVTGPLFSVKTQKGTLYEGVARPEGHLCHFRQKCEYGHPESPVGGRPLRPDGEPLHRR